MMTGLSSTAAAWCDYDSDGDLDIAAAGFEGAGGRTNIYRHDSGVFTDSGVSLPGAYFPGVAWGDYDNDGDPDLALSGFGGPVFSRIYRNDSGPLNSVPSTPTNLAAVRVGNQVTFSWTASTDDYTPSAGLSYNLRVGTTPAPAVMAMNKLMVILSAPSVGRSIGGGES